MVATGRGRDCRSGHLVRPDVVGVTVAAVGVVGDDDVRSQRPQDRHQGADGFVIVGVDEAVPGRVGVGSRHPGVTPASRSAQEDRCADAQMTEGRGEFGDPVPTQLVGVADGQLGPAVTDDLPSSPRVQVTTVTSAPLAV